MKGKIKFTVEFSQDEMEFLDTVLKTTSIIDKKVVLTTDIHAKATGTNQYHIPKSCRQKIPTKK